MLASRQIGWALAIQLRTSDTQVGRPGKHIFGYLPERRTWLLEWKEKDREQFSLVRSREGNTDNHTSHFHPPTTSKNRDNHFISIHHYFYEFFLVPKNSLRNIQADYKIKPPPESALTNQKGKVIRRVVRIHSSLHNLFVQPSTRARPSCSSHLDRYPRGTHS
jgi:hypothetical protein